MRKSKYHLEINSHTRFLNFFRKGFIITGVDRMLAAGLRKKLLPAFFEKLAPSNYLYKPNTTRKFSYNGLIFNLDVSDTVGHSNYFAINDEGHNLLYKLAKPGMIVYDIGANVGSTSLHLAKLVGEKGKVFSFEPDSKNFSIASINIQLNSASNLRIFNAGLGNSRQTAFQYNVNENNRGMMRILPAAKASDGLEASPVEIYTLDEFTTEHQLPPPELIKLDVEGFELKALKGGRNLLSRYKPTLFIELDDNNLREQQNSASELVTYLINLGYHIKNATTGEPLTGGSDFSHCHIDIHCTGNSTGD